MYEIDLNLPKQIVADVLSNHEIHSVAFVGCGASMSDLYPAKYFLANNTDKLNVRSSPLTSSTTTRPPGSTSTPS